jgi:hypothetical protein
MIILEVAGGVVLGISLILAIFGAYDKVSGWRHDATYYKKYMKEWQDRYYDLRKEVDK